MNKPYIIPHWVYIHLQYTYHPIILPIDDRKHLNDILMVINHEESFYKQNVHYLQIIILYHISHRIPYGNVTHLYTVIILQHPHQLMT